MLEDGFALTADGATPVAAHTDMPGGTPAMIDWWFGWHSDGPERYKLCHPQAHVYAAWRSPPPAGTRGRARSVGQTPIVDEYIGSKLIRAAIRFISPTALGFTDPSLDDPEQAAIVCARTGLGDFPIDVGYLVYHVRRTESGSEMHSRFWIGAPMRRGEAIWPARSSRARPGRRCLRPRPTRPRCRSIAPRKSSIWRLSCPRFMQNSGHRIRPYRPGVDGSSAQTPGKAQSAIGHAVVDFSKWLTTFG